MANDDIYEMNVDMTYSGQNITNVLHFEQDGTDGLDTGQEALAAIWVTNFKVPWQALLVNQVNIVQLRIRRLFPTQTQQFIFAVGQLGDELEAGLPPQQCAILQQRGVRGGAKGRRGAGHMKISGVGVGQVESGRIDAAYADKMNTLGLEFSSKHTDIPSGFTFDPVVLSAIDNVPRVIESAGSTSRIRTVYSRTIGVGA